jgi:hypothetical protein
VKTPVPPHYLVFRLVLVLVLMAALADAVWWIMQPAVLSKILGFLGV